MTVVTVEEPVLRESDLTAVITVGGTAESITHHTADVPLSNDTDPFLVAALLPAMARSRRLDVQGSVSPKLLESLPEAQRLLQSWNVGLRQVTVTAGSRWAREDTQPHRPDRVHGVACLFSGGVDSFYTALKHLDEITSLIFVHGFDISLERAGRREEVAAGVRQAATALGKHLVEVETNIRPFLTRSVPWKYSHGAAMASVALSLVEAFGKVFMPASHTAAEGPPPYGSHPDLDPLWSTERLEIVYDGLEAWRLDKVRAIKDNPVALKWLRVCQNRAWEGGSNCGRCEKCVRTLIYLHVSGASDGCMAFPTELTPDLIAQVRIDPPDMLGYWEADLRLLEANHWSPELVTAVRHAVGNAQRQRSLIHRISRRALRTLRGRSRSGARTLARRR